MSQQQAKADRPFEVCWLDKRKHLPTVLELDAEASADRRRIYEGSPWTVGAFREYLRAGSGIVVVDRQKTVVGFAMYTLRGDNIDVSKIVAPPGSAEDELLAALWKTLRGLGKRFLNLPLILELG